MKEIQTSPDGDNQLQVEPKIFFELEFRSLSKLVLEPELRLIGAHWLPKVKMVKADSLFRFVFDLQRSVSAIALSVANALGGLDPELQTIAGGLTSEERRELATKFEAWDVQLRLSAALAERSVFGDDPGSLGSAGHN